jgi:ribonuclease P protein component
MLASKNRLTGNQIDKVKEGGKLHQLPDFGVIIKNHDKPKSSRFAFVISNKVSKLAVQRNRIKRAMREAVRYNMSNVKKGYDVIYLVKVVVSTKSTNEIMNETAKSLKKLNLTK